MHIHSTVCVCVFHVNESESRHIDRAPFAFRMSAIRVSFNVIINCVCVSTKQLMFQVQNHFYSLKIHHPHLSQTNKRNGSSVSLFSLSSPQLQYYNNYSK